MYLQIHELQFLGEPMMKLTNLLNYFFKTKQDQSAGKVSEDIREAFARLNLPAGTTVNSESEVFDTIGKKIGIIVPETWSSYLPSVTPKLFTGKDVGFYRWHNRFEAGKNLKVKVL